MSASDASDIKPSACQKTTRHNEDPGQESIQNGHPQVICGWMLLSDTSSRTAVLHSTGQLQCQWTMRDRMASSPVMKEGNDQLQEHGPSRLSWRPSTMHALVHLAALLQGWRGLHSCGRQQAVHAVAQHVQHALAGCIECLPAPAHPQESSSCQPLL